MAESLPEGVRIVARLPLTEAQGPPQGFVAARLEPEPSGDDRNLFAAGLAGAAPALEAERLASDGNGQWLIELQGFDTEPQASGRWRRLGCYAAPLRLPHGPVAGDHG